MFRSLTVAVALLIHGQSLCADASQLQGTTHVFVFQPKEEFIVIGADTFIYEIQRGPRWILPHGQKDKIEPLQSSDALVAAVAYRGRANIPTSATDTIGLDIDCIILEFLGRPPEPYCTRTCASNRKVNPQRTLKENADELSVKIEECWYDGSNKGRAELEFPYLQRDNAGSTTPFRYRTVVYPDDYKSLGPEQADGIETAGWDHLISRFLSGFDPWVHKFELEGMDRMLRVAETCLTRWDPNVCTFLAQTQPPENERQRLLRVIRSLKGLRMKLRKIGRKRGGAELLQALDLKQGAGDLSVEAAACLAYDLVYLQLVLGAYFEGGDLWRVLDWPMWARKTRETRTMPPITLLVLKPGVKPDVIRYRPESQECPLSPLGQGSRP